MNREELEAKREEAKQKAAIAKSKAEAAKLARRNPPSEYVQPSLKTGDVEADSRAELDAVAQGFRKRGRDEEKRFRDTLDSEFWFAVCFQTRAQKEAFLTAAKLILHGDKYLDGRVVTKAMGIEIPPADVKYNDSANRSSAWDEFVQEEI